VERDDVAATDPPHPLRAPLRVAAVRMVLREDALGEIPHRPRPRVVRLDPQIVLQLLPHAVDLARRERRLGEALDEQPDRLRRGLARAPSLEREELLPVPELERRADALEAVRELRGAPPPRAGQEAAGRELRDAVRV